ncbi:hypothetical protein EG327_008623 [Venturia inaequalis]|uniref:PLAC8-domain-containing protein n=1 Tax=Venturia inaequalis TaxID=5025 RepID=A0A8H3YVA8_VENIN|nr:hypothetical protein EG327_008623 [Venturia inaequalis]
MAQKQEWSASGVDCCSPFTSCLLSWCVPCIQYGRVHHRLHKDSQLKGWSVFNGDCCAYFALSFFGCQWIVQLMGRGEIREKYNLKGNGCTDCLCACCCMPCDLVQQEKEIVNQEATNLINVQPNKLEAQNQMAYPQQQQPQQYQQQQMPQYPPQHPPQHQ